MNLSELRDDLRSRLEDDQSSGGFYSDAMLNRWLNQGNLVLCADLDALEGYTTENVIADQGNYDYPSDCLRVKKITWDNEPIGYVNFPELQLLVGISDDPRTKSGTPTHWWLWQGSDNVTEIWLYPVPSSDLSDGIKIHYYKEPANLSSDSNSPELPNQLHHIIVLYAQHIALQRDTLYTDSQRVLTIYDEWVRRSRIQVKKKQHERYGRIRIVT